MRFTYREEVKRRLREQGRHHVLIPIFSDTYNISRRIYEYDNTFFLVFNIRKQKYEVHCLENKGSTFSFTIPYDDLDIRTIRHLWETDLRVHGRRIFEDIEKSEEQHEKKKEKEWKNWVNDVAHETRSAFAKAAWTN